MLIRARVAGLASSQDVRHGVAGVDARLGCVAVDEEAHSCSVVAELVGDAFHRDAGGRHERSGAVAQFVWVPRSEVKAFGHGGERSLQIARAERGADVGGEHEIVHVPPELGCGDSGLGLEVPLSLECQDHWWGSVEASSTASCFQALIDDELAALQFQ